jgi:hypothetical protein
MHKIDWIDQRLEPKNKADPRYPDGIDLDCSAGAANTCLVKLPYPARRIGYYVITCKHCGLTGMVTTAGRSDDPRSIKMKCKEKPPVN